MSIRVSAVMGQTKYCSEYLQSVVESAASARAMTAAAAARAASLQDAHASVERLTEQMNGMEARCAQLASQLASEKDARQVVTGTLSRSLMPSADRQRR